MQQQERGQQTIPSKEAILKEIRFLFAAIAGLFLCIAFISSLTVDPIGFGFTSPTIYFTGALFLIIGLFSLWSLGYGINNLMRMRRQLFRSRFTDETRE